MFLISSHRQRKSLSRITAAKGFQISFAKNAAAYLRGYSPFSIRLSHAGDDEVLPSSQTEASLHHCSDILRDTSIPSWKQRLWICRTQPQNWKSCGHPGCAHEQLDVFSSAGIIIYQAEVLQIHCTTTPSSYYS